jgi:hypothetical protein
VWVGERHARRAFWPDGHDGQFEIDVATWAWLEPGATWPPL